MCQDRKRTRDLLIEYDAGYHHRGGLALIYPWENNERSMMSDQLFQLATDHGYDGTKEEFWNSFSGGATIKGTIDTFPVPGDEKNLYIDTDNGTLYYFKTYTTEVEQELLDAGAVVVGTLTKQGQSKEYEVYIPVRAKLLENSVLMG